MNRRTSDLVRAVGAGAMDRRRALDLANEVVLLERVVKAAGKLIAIAPKNDLYYALNKYCCEHMDEMIEALEALPDELCNTEE